MKTLWNGSKVTPKPSRANIQSYISMSSTWGKLWQDVRSKGIKQYHLSSTDGCSPHGLFWSGSAHCSWLFLVVLEWHHSETGEYIIPKVIFEQRLELLREWAMQVSGQKYFRQNEELVQSQVLELGLGCLGKSTHSGQYRTSEWMKERKEVASASHCLCFDSSSE